MAPRQGLRANHMPIDHSGGSVGPCAAIASAKERLFPERLEEVCLVVGKN
jgi:hypothetical protein